MEFSPFHIALAPPGLRDIRYDGRLFLPPEDGIDSIKAQRQVGFPVHQAPLNPIKPPDPQHLAK